MNWTDGKNSYVIFFVMALFVIARQTTKYLSSSLDKQEPSNLCLSAKNTTKEVVVVVRKGMSLSAIADGLGTSVERLCQLNPEIKDPNKIYVGQKIRAIFGKENNVFVVSWYGKQFHGEKMSNQSVFDMYNPKLIAHKYLPLGTKVRITCPKTRRYIESEITDRGPYIKGREFDLSFAAAQFLGMEKMGIAHCIVEIIG